MDTLIVVFKISAAFVVIPQDSPFSLPGGHRPTCEGENLTEIVATSTGMAVPSEPLKITFLPSSS